MLPDIPQKLTVLVEDACVAKAMLQMIFIMAVAYVVAFELVTGSMVPNVHIPQQAIR
jgi:hypothetical protein